MRAIVVRELGGPEVLRIEQVADPTASAGQVLIAVRHIGVNFTDVRNRIGDGLGRVPFTPGIEVTGTVRALGAGVSGFRIGQAVAAYTGGSAYAEFVCAPADRVFALPEQLVDQPGAAGMLVTIPLALNVVERAARIKPGETVLLHGAAGGVGTIVAQLIRHTIPDVRLFGTVGRPEKAEYARSFGYDAIFGYDDFEAGLASATDGALADVVLEPVGGSVQRRSLTVLAPFGRLVNYSNISREPQNLPDAEWLREHAIGIFGLSNGYLFKNHPQLAREVMQRSIGLVAEGVLGVDVTEVLPLDSAAAAHAAFEQRSAVGKFVLAV